MEKKLTYLVMVTADNHNKYYRMIPCGSTFTVEYGRIGATKQTTSYPISQWEKKYNEKVKKGYVDQTDLIAEAVVESKQTFVEKLSDNVRKIVDRLQCMARDTVRKNYTVSATAVTTAMCEKAQEVLNRMVTISDVREFNNALIELFTIIPRKMSHVNNYLANNTDEFERIVRREQDLLDVMRGQVDTMKHDNSSSEEVISLASLGIKIEDVDDSDIDTIKKSLGHSADKFVRAWRVTNINTQNAFDEFCKKNNVSNTRLLWHGSRNENWWSIINSGLQLKPTNAVITGKMFGYGIYFAPKAQKSIGYTSLSGSYWANGNSSTGFMALMDVAYGTPYHVDVHTHDMCSLTFNKLQQRCQGATCLHAHAGRSLRNDEIIVYKQEQVTIKYLVEIKK